MVIGTTMSIDRGSQTSSLHSRAPTVLSESKHLPEALDTTERSVDSGSLTDGTAGFTPNAHLRGCLGVSRVDVRQDQPDHPQYIRPLSLLTSPLQDVRDIMLFPNTLINLTSDVSFATKWRVHTSEEIHDIKRNKLRGYGVFHPARRLIYFSDCSLAGRLYWFGRP